MSVFGQLGKGPRAQAGNRIPLGGTLKTRRLSAAVAIATAGVLALSACTPPAPTATETNAEPVAVSVGWNQSYYEYNTNSATGNATANAIVNYMINSGFNYYDGDLNLVKDASFGTYEKTSDDPLTVTYTVNEGVNWSDGQPVTAYDVALLWVAQSGHFNTIADDAVEVDEEGNPIQPENEVYFNGTSSGPALISQIPEISEDGKTITFVYDKAFADWEINIGVGVPAHVTAMKALSLDNADDAIAKFWEAVQAKDKAVLAPISAFWNSGYQFGDTLPEDAALYLSSGPMMITDFVKDQYITVDKNPAYTGDKVPNIDRITIRYNEDSTAQLQALQNGEINLMSPQATADIIAAYEALGDGFDFQTMVEGTYEHLDLAQNNGGPFDAAAYGGDADKALKVRQAFLNLIPRNEIVEKLIVPLNPEAQVRNSFTSLQGSPSYDAITTANQMGVTYADVNVEAATALIEEAGVETPIDVRMLFGKSNVRRQNEFVIISDTVNATGLFNMVDVSSDEWGSQLSDTTLYDVALFGWQSTSTAVTESAANFQTGKINNFYGFSNADVDRLFDELAITTDADEQTRILSEVEKILVDQAFGLTIFQFPGATAWSTNLTGVAPISISPTMFWNFWEWEFTPAS